MLLYKSETTIKAVSKDRPNSLIFRISGAFKEITELEHNDKINVEVCYDEAKQQKYIKLYKKTD